MAPVDALKIDRAIVHAILSHERNRAAVTAVAQLAGTPGFGRLTEGIETEAQRDWFADIGCSELQGCLFERPQPADRLLPVRGRTRPPQVVTPPGRGDRAGCR